VTTSKENFYLATVEHKIPEWIPNAFTDVAMAGGSRETFENGPAGGGPDGFGVVWHGSASAGGQPVPAPGEYVLKDVTAWEDIVKFPDLDAYDWEGEAALQLQNVDRSQKPLEYGCWNSQFLRFSHLLGFENALVAMLEEPEASLALLNAITDYKIRLLGYIKKYFNPDIVTNYDDVATEKGLFMSPATYRTLIKPQHKRFNDAVKDLGMIPFQHTCGRCEDIMGDYIEEGAYAWSAAQPMNDIVAIQEKYADKIAVIGGFDSNGKPGRPDATPEEVDAEVKRVIETYAPRGSFVFMGFRMLGDVDFEVTMKAFGELAASFDKYSKDFYKK
jgi:hypothetical protein